MLTVFAVQGIEDASLVVMSRFLAEDREFAVRADCSTITIKAFDVASEDETYTATLTVSSVVFDTLQTDAAWDPTPADPGDDGYTGYNFKHTVPPTAFPDGNRTYQVEAKVTFSTGAVGWVGYWQNKTLPVFTS